MKFCLDTSGFIDAYERYYPPDVFPSIWMKMTELVEAGTIFAPEDIYKELEKKADGVIVWAKPHKARFASLDLDTMNNLSVVMAAFPTGFVDVRRSRSGADPIVVAAAMTTRCTVVTGEKLSTKAGEYKIPNVCRHFNIPCCGILEMFRQLRLSI